MSIFQELSKLMSSTTNLKLVIAKTGTEEKPELFITIQPSKGNQTLTPLSLKGDPKYIDENFTELILNPMSKAFDVAQHLEFYDKLLETKKKSKTKSTVKAAKGPSKKIQESENSQENDLFSCSDNCEVNE